MVFCESQNVIDCTL